MTQQKAFRFFAALLLAIAVLISSAGCDMLFKKTPVSFSELIEKGNISDLSLTIYYVCPPFFTFAPWSIDELIEFSKEYKVVVDGSSLEEHIDLLTQLGDTEPVPVENTSYINARMYYIFENKVQRKTFDVAMWGNDWNIYVNGVEVQSNKFFFDIVMPFLPEEAAKAWEPFSEF